MAKKFHRPFLIFLLILSLGGIFLLFRPFWAEIIIATALVSIFYPWHEKLTKFLGNKKYFSSFVLCLFLILIVVAPLSHFLVFVGKRAVSSYGQVNDIVNQAKFFQFDFLEKLELGDSVEKVLKKAIIENTNSIKNWLLSGTSVIVRGAGKSLLSIGIIILTMFFFFIEGKPLARRLILLSPLPNNYDRDIIKKFRQISRSTFISIFFSATVQGLLGAFGFFFVGWPFIFVFIIMTFLSLIPYIGSAIFYLPATLYIMAFGNFWQGLLILIWCILSIGLAKHSIKKYLIKSPPALNPIFVILSILGGVKLFAFWGIIIGPLVISLVASIFHIYETEFSDKLEK